MSGVLTTKRDFRTPNKSDFILSSGKLSLEYTEKKVGVRAQHCDKSGLDEGSIPVRVSFLKSKSVSWKMNNNAEYSLQVTLST